MAMNRSKVWLRILWMLAMLAMCLPASVLAEAGAEALPGAVTIQLSGANAEVPYRLMQGDAEYAAGTAAAGTITRLDDLAAGEYVLYFSLPQGIRMTAINGVPFQLEGEQSFSVPVKAGEDQPVQIELGCKGVIAGTVGEIPDGVTVTISGEGTQATAVVQGGAFESEQLWSGSYEVSMTLAQGRYAGEGWTVTDTEGGTVAKALCVLGTDGRTQLPQLAVAHVQRMAGLVRDANNQPVANAEVKLLGVSGGEVATAVTDAAGAWQMEGMAPGVYTLAAQQNGAALCDGLSIAVAQDETVYALLGAQAGKGSVSVTVFEDGNKNGDRDKYEGTLSGAEVSLYALEEDGNAYLVASAVTGENGIVSFDDLPSGEYCIGSVLPRRYGYSPKSGKSLRDTANIMEQESERAQVSASFTVKGQVETAIAAMEMSAVTGQVWLDTSADGIRDGDEPGFAGVVIEATGTKNGLTYHTVSDQNGHYELTQLRPGSYQIRYTLPEGMMFTRYSSSGGDDRSILTDSNTLTGSKTFDLNKPKVVDEQNVGVQKEGIIRVRCFLDTNANGLYDEGDLPLAGVKCEVRKRSTDETVDAMDSGADGLAEFHALRANTYKVRVVLPDDAFFADTPAGGNQFTAGKGKHDAMISDLVLEPSGEINLLAGAVVLSSISGQVYMDDDFSGRMDGGEKAASGMTVELQNDRGETVETARTDKNGLYSFEKLNPGHYRLVMQAKDGYAFTRTGNGSVMVNRGDGLGSTDTFFLPMDASMTGMDAGMIIPGSVSGQVYVDENDNGQRDPGEAGLTSVIVSLVDEQGTAVFTANPQADGSFVFDAVMPGTYRVAYELPERGVFANGTTLADNTSTDTFRMASGGSVTVDEIGVLQLPEMSGVFFDDLNANGLRDEGEAALPGVTIALTPENLGQEAVSAVSGEDGSFRIAGIRPGSYTLEIAFPQGYVMSKTGGVQIPVQAGAAVSSVVMEVPSGAVWQEQVLGAVRPAALEGRVWLDANNNGILDEADLYPEGEQIAVWDMATGTVLVTLTTDEDGRFATEGMIPGEYRLVYTPDENTVLATGETNTFRKQDDGTFATDVLRAVEGQTVSGASLGLMRYTNLAGQVWADENGMVSVLPGAAVVLKDAAGNQLAESVSDENGNYTFGHLLPGQYQLAVEMPEGYVVVEPGDSRLTDGGYISVMTQCHQRTASSDIIQVVMGAAMDQLNIGAVLPGRLGDVCWLDENGNGLYDVGFESGIPNLKIALMRGEEVVVETVTDQYGFYCFKDVYPSTYTMRVELPETLKPTTLRTDYPGIVSVMQESGETVPLEVKSNSANYDADMGFMMTQEGVYPEGYGQGATQIWVQPETAEESEEK